MNKKDKDGRTLLHLAAMEGNVKEIERLIPLGYNVNAQDNYGYTPIHLAEYNSVEASLSYRDGKNGVDYLLTIVKLARNGANENLVDNEGLSPRGLKQKAYEVEAFKQIKKRGYF